VPQTRRKRPWLIPAAVGAAVAGAVIAALVISLSPHSTSNATGNGSSPAAPPSHSASASSQPAGTGTTGAGGVGSPGATPTPTVGNLLVSQLQDGDCLTGANMQLNTSSPWPKLTQAVPCDQGHTAEVFYANNSYWSKSSPYPGNAAITKDGNTACDNAFQSYVGVAYNKSIYTWDNIVPNSSTWTTGDRGLHCVAYYQTTGHPAGETLHASIRGSGK
jgi:hypothetical protein